MTESELMTEYFPQHLFFDDEVADLSANFDQDADEYPDAEQSDDISESTEIEMDDIDILQKPLFESCPLTPSASNILLMKFKMRHNLTNEALSDLLKLIKLHCPTPNLCCQSMYFFKKQLSMMHNLKQPAAVCFHSLCNACYAAVESVHTKCPNRTCSIDLSDRSKSSFIELPLEAQLVSILESKYDYGANYTFIFTHLYFTLQGKVALKYYPAGTTCERAVEGMKTSMMELYIKI